MNTQQRQLNESGVLKGAVDVFVAYQFIKILTTPWNKTKAFELGIIDEKGKVLKKSRELKTSQEKKAYTVFHRLIWNIKRLLDKAPGGSSRLGSFAGALWLIKEEANRLYPSKNIDLTETIVQFEDFLYKNNLLAEDLLLEETDNNSNQILTKGNYVLGADVDTPAGPAKTGDKIVVKQDTEPFDYIAGYPVYRVHNASTETEMVVSYADIEKV